MNLKLILMQLGNRLVTEHGWLPNEPISAQNSTKPIVDFTKFVNEHPVVQQVLKGLGIQWPMKSGDTPPILRQPMDRKELREKFPDGTICVVISVPLGQLICSSNDGTMDGFNDIVDDEILGFGNARSLSDLRFKPVGIEGDNVLVQVTADCSDLLGEDEDEDEEQRRDEKRGLYPEHEDPAN